MSSWALKTIFRLLDSGLTLYEPHPKTKIKTIHQFVSLYGGPEIDIHKRYSSLLNYACFPFVHGVALPILFPITLFGFINIYIFETIILAYYFRKPPLFDNELNNKAMSILKVAPLATLLMGYWLLGNR
jgi:hypothetical protein